MKKYFLFLLLVIQGSLLAQTENSLTLYFIPSPSKINWNTPKDLTESVFKNEIISMLFSKTHSIGHANIQVNCNIQGKAVNFLTGMTGATNKEVKDVILKKKIGMGMLLHTFKGHLDDVSMVEKDFAKRFKSGKMSYLKFLISEETCARVNQYFVEFQARGYQNGYGLSNRPLYKEGAGCTAFAASFVEVAGLFLPELTMEKKWTRTLDIPLNLIGTEENPVSLSKIIYNQRSRWAKPEELSVHLMVWDPDLMYNWVKQVWKDPNDTHFVKEQTQKAYGLIYDARNVQTPTTAIWKE